MDVKCTLFTWIVVVQSDKRKREREKGKNGISTERRKEKTIEDAVKTGATRKRDRCARCINKKRKETNNNNKSRKRRRKKSQRTCTPLVIQLFKIASNVEHKKNKIR
jgi:hypothetical protein